MNAHEHTVAMPTQKTYFVIFAVLLALLVVTVAVAYAHLEHPWNTVIALVIATAKATLVVLYFMHVRYQRPLIWVTASAGLLWLFILLGLTFSDYLTRGLVLQEAQSQRGVAAPAERAERRSTPSQGGNASPAFAAPILVPGTQVVVQMGENPPPPF